jgi:hypothetical protein
VLEWLQDNLPGGYADALLWVAFALLLFFILLVVVRTLRRFQGGTFVLGGRNRRTRLAVMDATAIDSRRRLVLVRRDDVEHLILIGGPTDVVVEQDIRIVPRVARSPEGQHSDPAPERAVHREPPRQAPSQPVPKRAAEPPRPIAPRSQPEPVAAPSQTRLPPAAIPVPPRPAPPPATASRSIPAATPAQKIAEDKLLENLEITLDEVTAAKIKKPSADEEMTRLLGELTQRK